MSTVISEFRSLDQLLPYVRATEGVRDVSLEDDTIAFKFRDKDGDLMATVLRELDSQRLIVHTGLLMPEDNTIATLVAANEWNGESFSHDTFSYCGQGYGRTVIMLESHLLLADGVTEANIRDWLANFVGHMNRWEEVVIAKWKEIPTDKQIGSGGGQGAQAQKGASSFTQWISAADTLTHIIDWLSGT